MVILDDPVVATYVSSEFERDLIRSAYSALNSLHDPVRATVFALLIREWLRIVTQRISAEDLIRETDWFAREMEARANDRRIRRADRYRFALTGFVDDVALEDLGMNLVNETIQQLAQIDDTLNRYTHVGPTTYNLPASDIRDFSEKVGRAICDFFAAMSDARRRLSEFLLERLQEHLTQGFWNETDGDLDELSSSTEVESAVIEAIDGFDCYKPQCVVTGKGYVDVELNYGRGDDGTSFGDSYPLAFSATVRVSELEADNHEHRVDTSSFYGRGDEEEADVDEDIGEDTEGYSKF